MWTGGFLLRQAVQSRHCEGVLVLAAMEQDLTLKRITEFVYAQDMGCESRKLLSGAGSLNKLSPHKMQH